MDVKKLHYNKLHLEINNFLNIFFRILIKYFIKKENYK